jgi:hypothetical protein
MQAASITALRYATQPTAPPAATIQAIRYTITTAPPAASITALRYTLPTPPTAQAQILALRYTTAPAPPPTGTATLKGKVLGVLGPVANATITLNGLSTTTSPDGSYIIEGITLGTYVLNAISPFPFNYIYKAISETISLTEAKEYTKDIYLPLNIINISAMAGGLIAFISLCAIAVRGG